MLILILEFEASNLRARKTAHPAKLAYADSNPDFPRRRTILASETRSPRNRAAGLLLRGLSPPHDDPESIAFRLGSGSDESFVLAAFVDDQIAGMAGFFRSPEEKTRHKARVWGVYVKPSHRGKGIGRALMEELLRRARSQPGLEQVTLSVTSAQTAARALYEDLGFQPYGREPEAIKVGETYVDEDHMTLKV